MRAVLAWANVSWEGAASGAPGRTLVGQHYPGADYHRAHFDAVFTTLSDPRYLRLGGAAVVYVMRPHEVVETGFVDVWRERAAQSGVGELYLIGQARREAPDPRALGYDAGVFVPLLPWKSTTRWGRMRERARRGLRVFDYNNVAIAWERDRVVRYPDQVPCVFPNWDNTPRSGREGWVLEHASPDRFGDRLCHALSSIDRRTNPHGLVFVKSWNEWAEGNYLEPDRTFGRGWLDAVEGELTRHRAVSATGANP